MGPLLIQKAQSLPNKEVCYAFLFMSRLLKSAKSVFSVKYAELGDLLGAAELISDMQLSRPHCHYLI